MKAIRTAAILWLSLFATFLKPEIRGQGTLDFRVHVTGQQVVPPNASSFEAIGGGTLTGNRFFGVILLPITFPVVGTTGAIRGSAAPGNTGSVIVDLGASIFSPPEPPDPGGSGFFLDFRVSDTQLPNFTEGLWYLEVYTREFPSGHLRGQFELIPEPSTMVLFFAGAFIVGAFKKLLNVRQSLDISSRLDFRG